MGKGSTVYYSESKINTLYFIEEYSVVVNI